jgi:ADP-ribose pyrophosphatase YjhB (NUDIX family)
MAFNIHVSAFIANPKKQILLIKEADKLVYGKYNLPGGKLKQNESFLECARRSLKETLGLAADIQALLGVYTGYGEEHTLHFVFYVPYLYGQVTPNKEVILESQWVEEKDILLMSDREMAIPKKIRKALSDYRRGINIPLDLIAENIIV